MIYDCMDDLMMFEMQWIYIDGFATRPQASLIQMISFHIPSPPLWHIAHSPHLSDDDSLRLILQPSTVYAKVQESKVLRGDCSGQRRRSYIADQAVSTARDPSADSTTTCSSGNHPSYCNTTRYDRYPSSQYPEAASRPGCMASRSTNPPLLNSSADRRWCHPIPRRSARPVS